MSTPVFVPPKYQPKAIVMRLAEIDICINRPYKISTAITHWGSQKLRTSYIVYELGKTSTPPIILNEEEVIGEDEGLDMLKCIS